MVIDGVKIAREISNSLKVKIGELERKPHLTIFTCDPNFETQKFLKLKQARAQEIGVEMSVVDLASDSSTEDVVFAVQSAVDNTDGIIVQLPFPKHIDIETVLKDLPASHDVDAIGSGATELSRGGSQLVLPPVTAAIAEIATDRNIIFDEKKVVVFGKGRLVGMPTAIWLENVGAQTTSINRGSTDILESTQDADVLVLGVGQPGLITPHMIKNGVAIFDAGTSEEGGKLVGDADPACAEKASLFTPVPGGIGPITVAMIFKNLLTLMDKKL